MKYITVHASATTPEQDFTYDDLRHLHVDINGWSDVGYHWYIRRDGECIPCRPLSRMGAGVRGHNKDNIHICLEGGVNLIGQAEDNYTQAQKDTLRLTIIDMIGQFGVTTEPCGHRDWSPDLNGDGTIQANEFIKECPCFDVRDWWRSVTAGA